MIIKKLPYLVISAVCLALSAGASAADFPEKPIRFVVPFAAGTATDQLARALGQAVTLETKQQVIVVQEEDPLARRLRESGVAGCP